MEKTFKKGLLIALVLAITGCSQTTPLQNAKEINEKNTAYEQQFQKEFGFSVKDLSDGYVKRVLAKLGTVLNGPKLVDFLLYALYKGASVSDLIKNAFIADSILKNTVSTNSDVVAKKSTDSSFRVFIDGLTAISGEINTIAGTGSASANGDGLNAKLAAISYPNAVAVDSSNNIYFSADSMSIRKIDTGTGIITKVAGVYGSSVYGGDNGQATSATFTNPQGMAFDSSGNLIIADTYSHRVRKIDAVSKIITTIAGNGTTCSPATGTCGDGTAATSANLTNPGWVAIDNADNIYISDGGDHKIRKLVPNAGTNPLTYSISTIAGTGNQGATGEAVLATSTNLPYPGGIAVDSSKNVYISVNSKIRKIDSTDNKIYSVAGTGVQGASTGDGGAATSAGLFYPGGIALDSARNIYIVETNGSRIRKVNNSDGKINTIAGNGSNGFISDAVQATSTSLNAPSGVATDNTGNVYIADRSSSRIRKVNK